MHSYDSTLNVNTIIPPRLSKELVGILVKVHRGNYGKYGTIMLIEIKRYTHTIEVTRVFIKFMKRHTNLDSPKSGIPPVEAPVTSMTHVLVLGLVRVALPEVFRFLGNLNWCAFS